MKLDEIQDIEVLRKLLKELMCKCTKEVEMINFYDKTKRIKTIAGEWYYYDLSDEYSEVGIFDGNGYYARIGEFEVNEYFEFPKEGD